MMTNKFYEQLTLKFLPGRDYSSCITEQIPTDTLLPDNYATKILSLIGLSIENEESIEPIESIENEVDPMMDIFELMSDQTWRPLRFQSQTVERDPSMPEEPQPPPEEPKPNHQSEKWQVRVVKVIFDSRIELSVEG